MRCRSKTFWRIAEGLLALHAIFALIAWFKLPDRIPTHFGATGAADAWSNRSLFFWFVLVGASVGMHVLMRLLLLPGARGLWNIPEKERFLQLTPEQQKPVVELMSCFGAMASSCVGMVMFALQIGIYLTAHGYTKGLPWYIHVAMFVPILCLLIGLIPWMGAIERAILRASNAPEQI